MTKRYITDVHRLACNPEWRRYQLERFNGRCVYCGSSENVEIHHIVPKNQGGDNRDSNITCLCRECHAKAHNKMQYNYTYEPGRPRKVELGQADEVIDSYLDDECTMKEAMAELGVGKNTFNVLMREYKERTGDTRKHKPIFKGGRYEVAR